MTRDQRYCLWKKPKNVCLSSYPGTKLADEEETFELPPTKKIKVKKPEDKFQSKKVIEQIVPDLFVPCSFEIIHIQDAKSVVLLLAFCESERRSALEKVFKEKLELEKNKLEEEAVSWRAYICLVGARSIMLKGGWSKKLRVGGVLRNVET